MARPERNTDRAWEILESEYRILDHVEQSGYYSITAEQIKRCQDLVPKTEVNLEPRLITKYDTSSNMPLLFQEHGLSLLPSAHGEYLIGEFKTFHKLEKVEKPVRRFRMPDEVTSLGLDGYDALSEDKALSCAYDSGIIADFMGENPVYPALYGRSRANPFAFTINGHPHPFANPRSARTYSIEVGRPQIEIDGSYEGPLSFMLVEAKAHMPSEMMVRQLYFPMRSLSQKMRKPVRTAFLAFSAGVFTFWEYEFTEPTDYSSLCLVNSQRYTINPAALTRIDLLRELEATPLGEEPDARVSPFPQADNVDRTIDLISYLNGTSEWNGETGRTGAEIARHYSFDIRQASYYIASLRYLGLCVKGNRCFFLTTQGRECLAADPAGRSLIIYRALVSKPSFRVLIRMTLDRCEVPDKRAVLEVLRELSTIGDNETTLFRRSSTARAWCQWVLDLFSE